VRVSLYDIEGSDPHPFVDLIEEADALIFGSPTINGDAVKPVWDLLSSLTMVDVKGKLGAAFGSYGWSGEAVPMIEDRLRRLKLRVPVQGVKARLSPTPDEFAACHELGREIALHLLGRAEARVIDMASLA
jgi:flavorubredoxin